ncbi:hypothetical protein AXG93_1670s1020 [Marchantia polymorpha subsp. ruderalis]|uniref:Poly [ADP-ribose] polymerase n=1 Tax=Marchantia polymorpha subsp. ruderalis TaxID=1480154 RepID=A0A176WEZ7_MARPO|nr:hypothetical protein AXG93_1670s1020 [Marchantia polymorpha subsp. ruderalis]
MLLRGVRRRRRKNRWNTEVEVGDHCPSLDSALRCARFDSCARRGTSEAAKHRGFKNSLSDDPRAPHLDRAEIGRSRIGAELLVASSWKCYFDAPSGSEVRRIILMAGSTTGNSDRASLELAIHDACAKSPEGSDLLICAFIQALRSYRRFSVCAPFPSFLINDARNKNFKSASEAVAGFPSTKEVAWSELYEPGDNESVVQSLQHLSVQALMLLNWILRYRYNLQHVEDPNEEFRSFLFPKSPWGNIRDSILNPSFVLKVQEVDEGKRGTTAFEAIRTKHGSIMAFHGTTAENLHSILRCGRPLRVSYSVSLLHAVPSNFSLSVENPCSGLLNMSKTPLQRNGAMFGEGVYLSTDLSVALTFSKSGESWERSCLGSKVSYVLLCEIARGEGVECSTSPIADNTASNGKLSLRTHGTYVVVQNSDLLRIRYVLVYSDSPRTLLESQQQRVEVKQPINQAFKGKMSLFTLVIVLYLFGLIVLGYLKGAKSTRLSMLLKQLWWILDMIRHRIDKWLDSWTLPPKTLQ